MIIRLLIIEDDQEILEQNYELLNGQKIGEVTLSVRAAGSFELGIQELRADFFDIVLLDLCLGNPTDSAEKKGLEVLDAIKSISVIPVIFFSGLAAKILPLQSKLIRVVQKGPDGMNQVIDELGKLIGSKVALIRRKIAEHVDTVLAKYFWEHVNDSRHGSTDEIEEDYLGYLALRQVANSLSREHAQAEFGKQGANYQTFHPIEMYIYPIDISRHIQCGEIIREKASKALLIVLTPTCDIVNGKIDSILFAVLKPLDLHDTFKSYANNQEKYAQKLKDFLQSRQSNRYYFLPAALFLDDCYIDFQEITSIPFASITDKQFERLAKLDSPFAESISIRFTQYFGRIGTPDLDTDLVIGRLATKMNKQKPK